jgi:hypothetical protein
MATIFSNFMPAIVIVLNFMELSPNVNNGKVDFLLIFSIKNLHFSEGSLLTREIIVALATKNQHLCCKNGDKNTKTLEI